MLRDILAMIAVQTPGGLVFGTARKIDGQTVHFEVDSEVPAGTIVEFKIELPGLEETAMGQMRVIGVRLQPGSAVKQWSAVVVSVAENDEEIFTMWRRCVDEGSRTFALSARGGTDDWFKSQMMAGTTPAERARAVAQQEERRKRRLERARTLVKNAKRWPDPEDKAGGQSVASDVFRHSLSGSSVSTARASTTGRVVSNSGRDAEEGDRPRRMVAAALRSHLRSGGRRAGLEDDDSDSVDNSVFGDKPSDLPGLPSAPQVVAPADSPPAPEPASTRPTEGAAGGTGSEPRRASWPPQPRPTIPPAAAPGLSRATLPPRQTLPPRTTVPPGAVPRQTLSPGPLPAGIRGTMPPAPVPSLTSSRGTIPPTTSTPRPVAPPDDPTVMVDRGMLSLMFRDAEVYRRVYRDELSAGSLQVNRGGLGNPGQPVMLFVRFPSGNFVQLSGEIVLSSADFTGLTVQVDKAASHMIAMG
ncbi:MAG: hypothetical protein FJ102_18495 [Deltaproteobacteria bacterium]|nr:hypothetical protein [Deltaproteobacteria bacterium]